jgi:hypothetical protein
MNQLSRVYVFIFTFASMWNFSDPTMVHAQVLYGTIVGNVKDSSRAAVPGASVTVTNKLTNQSREAITNETGDYTLTNLQPGTYTVKVSLTGFKEFSQTDVQVANNVVTRVDATLEVGTLA